MAVREATTTQDCNDRKNMCAKFVKKVSNTQNLCLFMCIHKSCSCSRINRGEGGLMTAREAAAVLAWNRMASGEEFVTQFADSRVATACCFAGRVAHVGSAVMLEKALAKLCTGVVTMTCYHCHFCHDVHAAW